MGTTVDKLQKLLQSKQNLVNIVNEKVGTNYTIDSKLSDVINSVNTISGGSGSSYPEYDGEFEGNGELVIPGHTVKIQYKTSYEIFTTITKLKVNTAPSFESDAEYTNNEFFEEDTLISIVDDVNKVYMWGSSAVVYKDDENFEPIFLEENGHTTYDTAYELVITQDCTITLVSIQGGSKP